jgi:hypothetical protein
MTDNGVSWKAGLMNQFGPLGVRGVIPREDRAGSSSWGSTKMSEEGSIDAFIAHLAETCNELACPACDGIAFIFKRPMIVDEIAVKSLGQYILIPGGRPFFSASCQNCGYTMLFDGEAFLK